MGEGRGIATHTCLLLLLAGSSFLGEPICIPKNKLLLDPWASARMSLTVSLTRLYLAFVIRQTASVPDMCFLFGFFLPVLARSVCQFTYFFTSTNVGPAVVSSSSICRQCCSLLFTRECLACLFVTGRAFLLILVAVLALSLFLHL